MSLALLIHYLLLDMFRMLVRPSSGACDLLWIYFMCCIALVRCGWCYGVVRLGWCGILMQAEALLHLFHYLLLNMFRMLVHPSYRSLRLIVDLFYMLYCSGSMCVGVTVWFGWGGVVSLCKLKLCFTYFTIYCSTCFEC